MKSNSHQTKYGFIVLFSVILSSSSYSQGSQSVQSLKFYNPSSPTQTITVSPPLGITAYPLVLPATQGSPNTVLNNDGNGNLTWSVPIGAAIYVLKTASQSVTSSTVLVDDNELFYNVNANEKYEIDAMLIDSGANGGIKVALEIPVGATMHVLSTIKKDQEHHHHFDWLISSASINEWSPLDNTTSPEFVQYRGIISIGSSGGTIKVRWAQSSSNATATRVVADSYLKLTRIQ